ncbi:Pepco domain-containing protein [Streptomyces aidingensis]|uniref:Pepco domain-containing protein n=1 Tax=Streptomyces aidingensis TaxID=910347 RepID=A0A1I1TPD0_9ACTN|nr:hypothetical protein [Streptomyces aidingensis]SFD60397.1 hypothetical protein SAMN05421773_12072 [Streptomyces aidingensis]
MAPDSLSVIVSIDDAEDVPGGSKGLFRSRGEETSVREIPVAVLHRNLQRTVDALQQVIGELQVPSGGMPLREAQVSFEITAGGSIAIVGTSAQVSAKGAITLTFGS